MCWCCVLIHYQLIFIIILYGFVYRYNGANVIWHSGPIVEVLTPHQVKTKSSSEYVLVGKLDFETAIAKGTYVLRDLSPFLCSYVYSSGFTSCLFFALGASVSMARHFIHGFPDTWKMWLLEEARPQSQ